MILHLHGGIISVTTHYLVIDVSQDYVSIVVTNNQTFFNSFLLVLLSRLSRFSESMTCGFRWFVYVSCYLFLCGVSWFILFGFPPYPPHLTPFITIRLIVYASLCIFWREVAISLSVFFDVLFYDDTQRYHNDPIAIASYESSIIEKAMEC